MTELPDSSTGQERDRDFWSRNVRAFLLLLLAVTFALHSLRYYFLIDDAFISFRYAENLANGLGLVFNPGERVEGYSNFLWVLMMACGMKAGLSPETLSRVLGLAAGLALLLAAWRLALRLLPAEPLSKWLALLPVAFLVSNRSVATWATGGLETRFYTLLLVAGLLALDTEIRQGLESRPWSAVLFALLLLTRTDGFILVGTVALGLLALRGGRPGRHGWLFIGLLTLAGCAHECFRLVYYGEFFSNTVYAKIAGLPLATGVEYLRKAAEDYGLYIAVPVGLLALRWRSPQSIVLFLSAAVVAVQLLCAVGVGGDHFEYRYLDPVWPLLFVLAVRGSRLAFGARLAPRMTAIVATGALLALLIWNAVPAFKGFTMTPEMVSVEQEARLCGLWSEIGAYFKEHASPEEVLALRPVGVIPYVSGMRTFDMFGLTDSIVAHRPAEAGSTVPGHRKPATNEDILIRARADYIVGHPEMRVGSASTPDAPVVVKVSGRQFGLFPVHVRLTGFWFRFFVVSESAVLPGGKIDPTKIRTRIRPEIYDLPPQVSHQPAMAGS